MNERRKPTGDHLIDQLAAYDELLARGGTTGDSLLSQSADSHLHRELGREMECIRLLERVLPRRG
jgi:hypothetical protein